MTDLERANTQKAMLKAMMGWYFPSPSVMLLLFVVAAVVGVYMALLPV